MRAGGNRVEIPPITVRQAHGGSFELHETSWGMMGHDAEPPAVEAINEAVGLMRRGDHGAAISGLERVLVTYPNHTSALITLSGCYAALGDPVKALAKCDRAVEIEPNLALYRAQQIINAVNCPRRHQASTLFDDFQRRYPLLRDYDYYGIHAYLRTGEAPKANETLQRASALQPEEVGNLRPAVEAAVRAHQGFADLDRKVRQGGSEMRASEETLSVLKRLYADCAVDPFIQANFGLALARAGEHQQAAGLLVSAAGGVPERLVPHCWANAAYSLIASADWKRAMLLLDMSMSALTAAAKGPIPPCDAPGIATWIDRTGVIEPIKPNAADVMERALAQCPDASLVTPAIRDLLVLLRQFQSQVGSAKH
jgi:tetratricopeptide (TPR) repeat protein